jgi:hypothetical protein
MKPHLSDPLKPHKEEQRSGIAEGQIRCNSLKKEAIYFSEMPTTYINLQKPKNA